MTIIRGGYGWAQWTGPRRIAFMDWCNAKGLEWKTDEANYGFLKNELETSQSSAIAAVSKTSSVEDAVKAFERNFERAGVPHYESRNRWARIALNIFHGNHLGDTAGVTGRRYKVVARSGLRLREGPGTHFDIVGSLSPGQIVFVASVSDEWARVDVEGDGYIDGFASSSFLEAV